MTKGTLFIFSGLPGSGKSTLASMLASKIGATYLRIDTIEQGLREDCEVSKIDGKGYRLSYRIAQENLSLGNSVIADSVNPWELTRNEWNQVAKDIDSQYVNIEVTCMDQSEHRLRVENRASTKAKPELTNWTEVLNRDYHPWTEDRLKLETSGKTIEQSFNELVSILKSKSVI